MSFLNPVSEPVKRFSSTDVGAPQINYNARVAGDIKTVLKGCLVTGYGAKASAGWSIVNEVDHVAEFISPSAAMSDYRLGVDDTTSANTTWYYQYQDARVNPAYNAPTKDFTAANKTHASNGWQLLVTERGIIFIESVQLTVASKLSSRITYWGQLKSALTSEIGKNICFFNIGHGGAITQNYFFYNAANYVHISLSNQTYAWVSSATSNALVGQSYVLNTALVDLVGAIYLTNLNKDMLIAQLPAILSKIVNKSSDLYGVSEQTIDSRSVLEVCAGYATTSLETANERSRTFLIRNDYWEY